MFKLIDTILHQFQICFKRKDTFSWFVIIIIGMISWTNPKGISTIVGCLNLAPCHYESMLSFFRSKGFDLDDIKYQWIKISEKYIKPVTVNGKNIIIGDHIKISKEAKYMPGVKKHHQDSENIGKAENILGHLFGMIGILAEGSTNQCIPLDIELHDGIDEIKEFEDNKETTNDKHENNKETNCIIKMINMAEKYIKTTKKEVILLLDAYFPSKSSFNTVSKINENENREAITLIMRAKSNTVAFEAAEVLENKGVGRPKKYGKKIIFKNLFKDNVENFKKTTLKLYGKKEIVEYYCINLLWRPIKRQIRFVLVKTGDKTMILMCSNLTMNPEDIIISYSYRFKIEVSFKMLKHIICGFRYHFWTKAMPKVSKYETKTDVSKVTDKKDQERILSTLRAIEVYTFLSCISMGILTIISLEYPTSIWNKFSGWLRTRSSAIPSIEVVRSVIYQELTWNFDKVSKYATLSKIKKYQLTENGKYEDEVA
jgi:hypothetical protein